LEIIKSRSLFLKGEKIIKSTLKYNLEMLSYMVFKQISENNFVNSCMFQLKIIKLLGKGEYDGLQKLITSCFSM